VNVFLCVVYDGVWSVCWFVCCVVWERFMRSGDEKKRAEMDGWMDKGANTHRKEKKKKRDGWVGMDRWMAHKKDR
jgi:hypothetical protein